MFRIVVTQAFAARFAARSAAAPAGAPASLAPPSFTGTPVVGQSLTGSDGVWAGDPTPSLSRAWLRNGAPIPGATGPTYAVVEADDGAELALRVTATNAAGVRVATSAAATARFSPPIAAGSLSDLVLLPGVSATPSSLSADFTVPGDADLSGVGFSLAPASDPLPAGLSLSANGVLAGTPGAAAGPATIVVRGANSGGTADSAFTLTIADAPASLSVTSGSVRFPARNIAETSTANMSYIAMPNFAPSGNAIFNGSGAMVCRVGLPLAGYLASGVWQKPNLWIAGNAPSTALANSFRWSLTVSANPTITPHRIQSIWRTASTTRSDSLDLPLGNDPVHALLVLRDTGTNFLSEVYIGGTRIAVATGASFAGNILRSSLVLGGMNSGTGTTPATPSGSFGFFDGMCDFFGYTDGTPSQADFEAISGGVDPQTQIASWRWGIAPKDPTLATYAAFGTAAALRGDATRVGTLEMGSDIVSAAASSLWFRVDPLPDGTVWCVRGPGFAQGRVKLSGVASGLSGAVEARVYDRTTGRLVKDWTALAGATLAGGAGETWEGALDCGVNIGWAGVDVRPASAPAMARRVLDRVGVGYDLALIGQSQVARSVGTGINVLTPVIPAEAAVGYATRDGTGLFTATNVSPNRRISDGVGHAAIYLHKRLGGIPCRIISLAEAGTGFDGLMDDALPDREYSNLVGTVLRAGSTGLGIALDWGTNNLATRSNFGPAYLAPLFEGATPVGPFAPVPYNRDNWLGDGQLGNIPLEYGFVGLSTHISLNAGLENATIVGGQGEGAAAVRAATLAFAAAGGYTTGPGTHDYRPNDGEASHQKPSSIYGHARQAIRLVECALRALGSENAGDPEITGVTRSGANLDVTVALARWTASNGARLQTAWAISGFPPPANWPVVQGFEVNEGGGWSNGNAQTGTAPVVFTASIIDDGSTDGTAVVRLTRASGTWAAGTQLRYCAGGPLDYGLAAQPLELIHGLLFEGDGTGLGADGQLAGEGGIGLPVAAGWTATAA